MWSLLRRGKNALLPPVGVAELRAVTTVPCLIVVSRARPDIFEYLQHHLAHDDRVEVVILDRRSGWGRRRTHAQPDVERRRGDLRQPPSMETDLTRRDFVIVPRQHSAR